MFLIRQAVRSDFRDLFKLAQLLDSYNLPADPRYVRQLLRVSEDSFRGRLPRSQAKYLFVLEERDRVIGCSLILAKHGTRGKPHLWLGLESVTRRSRTLAARRSHRVLRLGYTENGPTEVGGLVVLPGYRHHSEHCGLQISFVRFLYMRMHPGRFEPEVLVEYRGPMGVGGRSPFWEAVGRVFTGLSYRKADRLSVQNKEFILGLFPREPIYCALLPEPVQRAIGAIHPAAQRAAALLRGVGFRPLPQIEPFDGGPYYAARRTRIRVVRRTRKLPVLILGSSAHHSRLTTQDPRLKTQDFYLVATEAGGFFRAARVPARIAGGRLQIGRKAARLLRVQGGEKVYGCRF